MFFKLQIYKLYLFILAELYHCKAHFQPLKTTEIFLNVYGK